MILLSSLLDMSGYLTIKCTYHSFYVLFYLTNTKANSNFSNTNTPDYTMSCSWTVTMMDKMSTNGRLLHSWQFIFNNEESHTFFISSISPFSAKPAASTW